MLALSVPTPYQPPTLSVSEAVTLAVRETGAVPGAFASPPCTFHPLENEGEALMDLRPDNESRGVWVLVTSQVSSEADHRAHLRERCRTAAQRFVLTLACEGIDATWIDDVPEPARLRAAGFDVGAGEPVGLMWCSAA